MANAKQIIDVDLAVIGAGPGGYPAAFLAADRGMSVALIDKHSKPGGVCLHVGCIPSKALLHVAALIEEAKLAKKWGVTFGEPDIDLDGVRAFKQGVVDKLVGGVEKLAKARKVRFIAGHAVFIDNERVRIEDHDEIEVVHFKKAIVATGSSPVIPPGLDLKSDRLMDSTGALALTDLPARLLVIGGGYIGLELATVYAALGSKVTIVEMTGGLLPGADRDLVRPVHLRMKKAAEAIHLETKVTKIEKAKGGLKVTMEGKAEPATQTFDRVLVSVGRRPNSRGFGLENTGAKTDERGFIVVDAQRRTADPNIYAIGDVAGEPMLAHKATREARVAVEVIAGEASAFDPAAIPAVVFTDPELAWCGLTEDQAKAEGRAVNVQRFPWGASGRAITLDRTDGATKIITDPDSGVVLGVGIVGKGAGELIAEGVLAMEMGAVAEDLAATIHPHPTTSETIMEAAEMIGGAAVHLFRPAGK